MKMNSASGFSLIELMTVVVVIGVLSSVAYPSYADYVRRSRIADATANLGDFRIRQERYFQDNRTYASAGTTCGAAAALPAAGAFTYRCAAASSTTYVVTATGSGSVAGFTFTVDQDNARRTTASPWVASPPALCWIMKKGDAC